MRKQNEEKNECAPEGVKIMIVNHGRSLLVWVEGVKRVLLFLPSCVRVLLKNKILCLDGRGLLCTTYGNGAIEVIGEIEHIRFESTRLAGEE